MNQVYKIVFVSVFSLGVIYALHNQPQESWAEKTLKNMTLQEKIGQLFMVATTSCFDQQEEALASSFFESPYTMDQEHIEMLIKTYHIGGLIFIYKSTPGPQIDMVNHYQKMSKVPLLIGQDCEWGLSMRLYETIRFPHNMTLGAIEDDALIYEVGKEIGRQCKAIGVHINFAPVVDVNNNPNNPVINDRSFGEDKERVAKLGTLFMNGLHDAGVIAFAKHFPGHGDTDIDSHLDLPRVPHAKERLHTIELYPFKRLIDEGVMAIMNAHLEIPAFDDTPHLPSTLSYSIVTDLLQKQLGFNGLIITDALGMKGVTKYHEPGQVELKAFLAGNDILLCPVDTVKACKLLERAVKDGIIPQDELDRRVLKILKAKEWVFERHNRFVDKEKALQQIDTPAAHELKKKLYQEAITVVAHNTLSIRLSNKDNPILIHIGGDKHQPFNQTLAAAFDMPTIDLSVDSTQEEIDAVLDYCAHYNKIVVAIFEMNKFARKDFGLSISTRALIKKLGDSNKHAVLTLFGNPYSLTLLGKYNTAIIVAYEDDPDAQVSAARIITGSLNPQGTLPVATTYSAHEGLS